MKKTLSWKGWSAIALVMATIGLVIFSIPRLESEAPRIVGPEFIALGASGIDIELEI